MQRSRRSTERKAGLSQQALVVLTRYDGQTHAGPEIGMVDVLHLFDTGLRLGQINRLDGEDPRDTVCARGPRLPGREPRRLLWATGGSKRQ